MSKRDIPPENAPRSPVAAIVQLLKDAPDAGNVRVLIARQLATAVYNRDSEEVLYWAVIHHGVFGGGVELDVRSELIAALNYASSAADAAK